jgi:hypothetical protein
LTSGDAAGVGDAAAVGCPVVSVIITVGFAGFDVAGFATGVGLGVCALSNVPGDKSAAHITNVTSDLPIRDFVFISFITPPSSRLSH